MRSAQIKEAVKRTGPDGGSVIQHRPGRELGVAELGGLLGVKGGGGCHHGRRNRAYEPLTPESAVLLLVDHLDGMQERGLTVRTPDGEFTIPVSAAGDTSHLGGRSAPSGPR